MVLGLLAAGGAAAYGYFTQDEAESQSSTHGERSIDAYQIYQQVHGGPGATSIMQGQSSADMLASRYEQRLAQIEQLDRKMDAAWTGDGGAGARLGAEPLKIKMEDSNTNLNTSSKVLDGQYGAFDRVSREVQPLPDEPPDSGFLNDINPMETDTDRAIADYNQKAQRNVDAFNVYFEESQQNAHALPKYSDMRGEFGDIKVDDSGGGGGRDGNIGIDDPGTGGVPPGGSGGYTGGNTPGGNYPGGNYPGGNYPGGNYPGGNNPGGDYPGGNYPGGNYPGGNYPGGNYPGGNYPGGDYPGGNYPGGDYETPEWDDSTSASSFSPSSYKSPDFAAGPSAFGPGGGYAGGNYPGSGGGAGAGAGGAGGVGGAFGPGAGAPGAGAAAGAGSGAGAVRGGMPVGGAAAAGGAGAGGARGGMMPMGAGGRGGKGSDDEEHETKYLIDEDGDTLFGTDERTAPPVIGE